ncbi:unnamed protein product [Paramecium octaurelia]|uniref:Uncharacterized protein n=1 Tax=Paramecium octaurelia TaxID=43137 RepID=A0A8S1XHT8_PAROT|nr:unnamed protein product [Paramecium octaurelia]
MFSCFIVRNILISLKTLLASISSLTRWSFLIATFQQSGSVYFLSIANATCPYAPAPSPTLN